MGKAAKKENDIKCARCGKKHYPEDSTTVGNNIGASRELTRRVMKIYKKPANKHPLSSGKGNGCAQAHHLICSESMNNDTWKDICSIYGYDINCAENGVMLPRDARVACQENVPMHEGNHNDTIGKSVRKNYVNSVKEMVDNVARKIDNKPCEELKNILDELHQISRDIGFKVLNFNWTLTSDGSDYHFLSQAGCMDVMSWIAKNKANPKSAGWNTDNPMTWNAKKSMPHYQKCSKKRNHQDELPVATSTEPYFLEPAVKGYK